MYMQRSIANVKVDLPEPVRPTALEYQLTFWRARGNKHTGTDAFTSLCMEGYVLKHLRTILSYFMLIYSPSIDMKALTSE